MTNENDLSEPKKKRFKMRARKTVYIPKKPRLVPEKEPFTKKRKSSPKIVEGEKKKVEGEKKKLKGNGKEDEGQSDVDISESRGFVTQCRPQGLCNLVQNLNEQQKEAVKSIGFGGLLHLCITSFRTTMLRWLVTNFNGGSQMLKIDNNRCFVITADDVNDVFLLPRKKGSDVLKLGRNETCELLVKLKEEYDLDAKSPLSTVRDAIEKRVTDGGVEFKQLFVLYSLASFLTPTSNRLIDLSTLKSLVDVERISEYDWCSYVLKKLCKAVSKYNSNPQLKNVSGCVLLLQILYFHKLKWHGIAEPCTLPLLQHWTNDKIRTRIREESDAGHYGQGELIVGTYPVSLNYKTNVEEEVQEKVDQSSVEKNEVEGSFNGISESSRFIKYKLPVGEPDSSEIRKIAKDDIHETLLLMKRDISLVSDYHMRNLLKIKKKMEGKHAGSSSESPALSASQQFFSDPKIQKYIDEVVEKCTIMKKVADEMPSFDLLTPEAAGEEKFNDDVMSHQEVTEAILSVGSKSQGKTVESDDFWLDKEEIGYVSDFMNTNKNIVSHMDREHKEIVDYCLFVDETLSQGENLFQHGRSYTVPREDIITLNPLNKIYISVIDAWSLSINHEQAVQNKHRRFCFNLAHSLYLAKLVSADCDLVESHESDMRDCWENWLRENNTDLSLVDMIFVPFRLDDHFVAVVINFFEEKIQYLDNRKYDDDANEFFHAAKIVHNQMVTFLKGKNHVKADGVLKYKFENVAFIWQTRKRDLDCGVYLMHHMKYFEGVVYSTPNLSKAAMRRVIRAEICASIVVDEVNDLRLDVLNRVLDFYKKKPELQAKISALKRDKADNKRKKKQKK